MDGSGSGCLEGKAVLVTGGGRGIGRAVCLLFAREGARLVVDDVGCDAEGNGADPAVAAAVAGEILASGGEAIGRAEDAADPASAPRLVQAVLDAYGRLDAVVCVAGIRQERSLLKTSDADLDRMLSVHLRGPFALMRAAAETMVQQGEGGAIVLTTGSAAFFGAARSAATGAAWAAVTGMVRSAAVDLRRHRVRVNALCPTARTRQTEDLPLFRGIAEGSMTVEHVAPVAAFLASDLSGEITGEVVGIAGGRAHTLTSRESAGSFSEGGPLTPEGVRDLWPEITRA